ncbi:MAG: hypothetical protein GY851_24750 [bacterium]|nr:hypothetical protein [bacterium]
MQDDQTNGLLARLWSPRRLVVAGDRENLATLARHIRAFVSSSAGSDAREDEASVVVPLSMFVPGDFKQLRIALAETVEPICPFREYGARLPATYKSLVEMDTANLAVPATIRMTYTVCDIAVNACMWSGWILSGADGMPASVEPVCHRCGKPVRADESASFVRSREDERLQREGLEGVECIPFSYMGGPEGPGDHEPEDSVDFPDGRFLTAFREADVGIVVRGNRESLLDLSNRCLDDDPEDRIHDHIHLDTPGIPDFEQLLLDSGMDASKDWAITSHGPDPDAAPPDLVAIRYGLCVREICACEWQGWFLECTFHYDGDRPKPEDLWQAADKVSPEWLCPRCGRGLIDIHSAKFRPA